MAPSLDGDLVRVRLPIKTLQGLPDVGAVPQLRCARCRRQQHALGWMSGLPRLDVTTPQLT
jgi:hypothetical protein